MSDVTEHTAEYGTRYDACELLGPPVKRLDGTVIFQAVLARPGTQVYLNADGSKRIEYRSADVLRRAVAARKYDLTPATITHSGGWLTAANVGKHLVGTVGQDVRVSDEGLVIGSIVVHTESGVRDVTKNGYSQISPGYKVRMNRCPNGIASNGDRADFEHEEITEVNHSAFVRDARGGPIASVRLDAADVAVQVLKGKSMDLDQLQEEVTKQRVKVATLSGDLEVAQVHLRTMSTRFDEADKALKAKDKEYQELKARFDAQNERINLDSKSIDNQVQTRVQLETEASSILPATALPAVRLDNSTSRVTRFAGHSNDAIRRAVIEHVTKVKLPSDVNEHYLAARYDAAIETYQSARGAYGKVVTNMDDARSSSGNPLAAKAAEFAAASADAANLFIPVK